MQLAERMFRLGTESAFEVLARAQRLAQAGHSIINLGIGQPDFPTPDNIVAAAQKALADGHHGYTPANGILPLREAVAADLLRRHKVSVHPDQIAPVNAAYMPSAAELARAERIVAAFHQAEAKGEAAVQVDGEMVDYPVAYRAQALLDSFRKSR